VSSAVERAPAPGAAPPGGWWVPWLLVVGALGAYAGPANGDFPSYLAQARALDLWDRATHAGFVALLVPLAWLPPAAFPFGAAAATVWAAHGNTRDAVGRWLSLLVATPVAAFPEVDVVWVAALLSSVTSPLWAAASVTVSPAALLALPAVARSRAAWAAAFGAVALLTLGSAGGWWWGERGVLHPGPWLPGRSVGSWVLALPWLLVPAARWDRSLVRDLLCALPLVALPADVPGWVVPALRLARAVDLSSPGSRRWVAAQVVVTAVLTLATVARVREENVVISRVAASLAPGDGVVAPFSWGARLSVVATGDPYGLRWHPPGGFLRDQRAAWCAAPPTRVWTLPPGSVSVRRPTAAEECP
jgi:hypothetical protein